MNIYISIILILIAVAAIAVLINGIEDYNSRFNKISFNESLEKTNMPLVTFKNGRRDICFLVDSGSDVSYIDSSVVKHLKIKYMNESEDKVLTANGYMDVAGMVTIDLKHGDTTVEGDFIVGDIKDAMDTAFAPKFIVRGILGSIFLKRYNSIIDYKNNELKYKKEYSKVGTSG